MRGGNTYYLNKLEINLRNLLKVFCLGGSTMAVVVVSTAGVEVNISGVVVVVFSSVITLDLGSLIILGFMTEDIGFISLTSICAGCIVGWG